MSGPPKPDYYSWKDVEHETIDPKVLESGDDTGAYDDEFSAEIILYRLQQEVEKELQDEVKLIAYGILEDEIRPAVVKPSEDGVYIRGMD